MDIARLDKAVDGARGIPYVREFEALQGIVNTWVLRFWVFPEEVDLVELYNWYVGRLIKLNAKLLDRGLASPHMYASQDEPYSLAGKIQAILASLPDMNPETSAQKA